ncbi:MAG TPA: hypothetical protein VLN73_00720 [Alphaproteobacteria bacterium]|nr:hypothetical protein [Alphaproteobacteria bacterium]
MQSPESRGPYSVFVYGGKASSNPFSESIKFETTDVELLAGGVTARLYRFDFGLEVEGEMGAGRRFGDDRIWEFWVAAGLRWRDFPWNHIVNTTLALAFSGLHYTTAVSPYEEGFQENDGVQILNFYSPELTLSLPSHPEIALLLRLHHRSSIFGLLGSGSANFYSVGFRFQL